MLQVLVHDSAILRCLSSEEMRMFVPIVLTVQFQIGWRHIVIVKNLGGTSVTGSSTANTKILII